LRTCTLYVAANAPYSRASQLPQLLDVCRSLKYTVECGWLHLLMLSAKNAMQVHIRGSGVEEGETDLQIRRNLGTFLEHFDEAEKLYEMYANSEQSPGV
jgi:hypothetical protein